MNKTLPLALSLLLLAILPSAASAATATADIRVRNGVELGPVTFKAAKGERNDVTVTNDGGLLRIPRRHNRVRARGDCKQVNRHTALCPSTEDIAQIRLGNRNDSRDRREPRHRVRRRRQRRAARVVGRRPPRMASAATTRCTASGRGDDLTGGPGRDRVFGGSGDDDLFDGETDAQAAADLYRGGSSRDTRFQADIGDTIDYSKRKRALDIDLSRSRVNFGSERDVVRGLESIVGGSAGDKLSGDGDDNWIFGKGGSDRIRGRGGDDLVRGDGGNDRVSGEERQRLRLRRERSAISSRAATATTRSPHGTRPRRRSIAVRAWMWRWPRVSTRLSPARSARPTRSTSRRSPRTCRATRRHSTCRVPRDRGCSGTLALTGLTGESYGAGEFAGVPHGVDLFTPVEVDLTPAGRDALRDGQVIVLTHGTGDGGFRAFMQIS